MWTDKFYEILNDLDQERFSIDDDLEELKQSYIERAETEIKDETERFYCIESIKSKIGTFYMDY